MKLCSLFLRLTIALSLLYSLVSCRFDTHLIASVSDNEITLFVPAREDIEVRSNPTSSECYIYNAAVLFVNNSNTVTSAEYITSISNNGTRYPSLTLTNTPSSDATMVVVCNFDTDVTASDVESLVNSDLDNAKSVLKGEAAYDTSDGNTDGSVEVPLLMYGSGTYTWGGDTSRYDLSSCQD